MRLARIRPTPHGPIELAACFRVDDDGEWLVSLAGVEGCADADPVAALSRLGVDALQELVDARRGTEPHIAASAVDFEPPVATCTKICCLALNYSAHAVESNLELPPDPVLFFKPPSALLGHRGVVRPPSRTVHVEHEIELGVVIGRRVRDLAEQDWASAVAGYTIINDMTARDLQLSNLARNQPWDQAKCFDTFAPAGPYLVTPDELADPHDLDMVLTIGGDVRQQANTAQMVFGIPRLLADLSNGMTLMPGDIIATGTVAGISPLGDGDVMAARIDGIGTLENPVVWASGASADCAC